MTVASVPLIALNIKVPPGKVFLSPLRSAAFPRSWVGTRLAGRSGVQHWGDPYAPAGCLPGLQNGTRERPWLHSHAGAWERWS